MADAVLDADDCVSQIMGVLLGHSDQVERQPLS